VRHLRQKHRAKLAGADQCDANRLAGRKAGAEEAMKVHERNPIGLKRVPDAVQRETLRRRAGTDDSDKRAQAPAQQRIIS
jgi:hypothetical protein